MTPLPVLLTTAEVADLARVGRDTVGRWARSGRLAALSLPGGQWRFRREDVEALCMVPRRRSRPKVRHTA